MSEPIIDLYKNIAAELTADGAAFALSEVAADGRRVRVYAQARPSLAAIFNEMETAFAARCLVHEESGTTSYAELFDRAKRLGGALWDEFGVRPGAPVGIAIANSAEWLIAFVAVTWIGGIAVLFNSRGAADELAAAIATIGTWLVIADGKRAAMVHGCDVRIIAVDDGTALPAGRVTAFAGLLAHAPATPADVAPDAPAAILFTSGTTGRPKGAVLTQRNLTNMYENLAFLSTAGIMTAARTYGMEVDALRAMIPPVSTLLVFPFFHISGLTAFFVTAQAGGMLTILRRWSAAAALPVIAANKVTMLSGPPLAMADLLEHEAGSGHLATLNNIAVGGQATPSNLIARVSRMLPMAGQSGGWGATEVSGSVSSASGAVFAARPGSCGLPSPLIDLRVVDEDGRDAPPGGVGELWVRGALVMRGYWNAPEATAAAFAGDWYKTGDVGFLDTQGFIFLVDRKKDMVICGGENVYCAEVERVLSADEAFVEIALFGVPDERLGERAVAAVTLLPGESRTEAEVKACVRASLAEYKVPSAVVFDLGPFPRNVTGKVNKALLRNTYLARLMETV